MVRTTLALKRAVDALNVAVSEFNASGGSDGSRVLAAVFELNNEIGRLFRSAADSRLRELQLDVNEVTKAAKRLDGDKLARAMEKVRERSLQLP